MGKLILENVLHVLRNMTPKEYTKLYKETEKKYGKFFRDLDAADKREQKKARAGNKEKFVVRHYDGFDNHWIDVSKPVSKEEADKIWNKKTKNGKEKTTYGDIDYYSIFPADTKMLH